MANRVEVEAELTKVIEAVKALLLAKNASYGDDNLRRFGRYGILVRVSDKIERIRNLIESGKMGDPHAALFESEKDTWMDIAGYAIQAVRFINEEEGR
jgi:hypothetical protein